MLIFSPQTPRPDIRSCRSGNGNLVCVNRCRCVGVGVPQFRGCCHQVNTVGNHRRGCRMPEGVGMDMGSPLSRLKLFSHLVMLSGWSHSPLSLVNTIPVSFRSDPCLRRIRICSSFQGKRYPHTCTKSPNVITF